MKNLRKRIRKQLSKKGADIKEDSFEDKSSSWLLISSKDNDLKVEIGFNYKGTKIKDVIVFNNTGDNIIFNSNFNHK